MKRKKVLVVVTFLISNIFVSMCTFFVALYNESMEIIYNYNAEIDDILKNLQMNIGDYDSDMEVDKYLSEQTDVYQRLANTYYKYNQDIKKELRMYGATFNSDKKLLAESGNKWIVMEDVLLGNHYEYIYRFFDYEKHLSKEEIDDINEFFKCKSGLVYMYGKMDDKYVYPEYIVIGDIYEYTSYEDMVFNTDYTRDDYEHIEYLTGYKDVFVYKINKTYDYEEPLKLREFATPVYSESLSPIENAIDVYVADVSYFSEGEHIVLTDIKTSELYREAKENLLDKEVLSNYTKNNIFDYERICVKENNINGEVYYDCLSFEGRPYKLALEYIMDVYYEETVIHIIHVLVLFDIIFFICVKVYFNKKRRYDDYARNIFYEVTDKLKSPMGDLKKLIDETNNENCDEEYLRSLIDRKIVTMDENIRDVLDLSKLQAGVLGIDIQEIELSYLVENIVKKNDYRRKIVFDMDKEVTVYGDIRRLATVIDCFIGGVAKETYSDEEMFVTVNNCNGRIHFEVTNNKKLIKKSMFLSKRISNKMKKLDNMVVGGVKLMLSMGYLDMHNGNYIWSTEDGNAIFAFELPSEKPLSVIKTNKGNVKDIYGIVAHEIKTPLSVIKLHNEVIREGILTDEEKTRYKKIINDQIEIINGQLEQLSDVGNIDMENIQNMYQWVNIEKLVKDILSKCQIFIEDKDIEVSYEMPNNIGIVAYKIGIEAIMSNYIINAIKYTNIGGKINIMVQDGAGYVIVRIVNDRLNNIDEIKKKTINQVERDGIGLLIAKRYLDLHRAKYGAVYNDDTVEYWFKIKKGRGR